jgi:seryl-tRNA synthetase
MLDIKLLRNNLAGVAEQLKKRNFTLDPAQFQALEDKRKT